MPWDWIIVIGILIFLMYAALVIKNEKHAYEDFGVPLDFHDFELLVPSWWGLTEESEFHRKYERTDTRYDWFSRFEKKPCEKDLLVQDAFLIEVKRAEVEFDEGPHVANYGPEVVLDPETRKYLDEAFLRVESTATQFKRERIYLDLVVIKREDWDYYYVFYSWSSVLNGLLEGPFFDEMIKKLKMRTREN